MASAENISGQNRTGRIRLTKCMTWARQRNTENATKFWYRPVTPEFLPVTRLELMAAKVNPLRNVAFRRLDFTV
jgi:hypothetical protein